MKDLRPVTCRNQRTAMECYALHLLRCYLDDLEIDDVTIKMLQDGDGKVTHVADVFDENNHFDFFELVTRSLHMKLAALTVKQE
jgi:hypothetical protein